MAEAVFGWLGVVYLVCEPEKLMDWGQYNFNIVHNKVGKWPIVNMTEGKSVGGEAPSAPYGYCTVEVLVGKWIYVDMS